LVKKSHEALARGVGRHTPAAEKAAAFRRNHLMLLPRKTPMLPRAIAHPAAVILVILVAYICFTLATLPTSTGGLPILSINKGIFETVSKTLADNWSRLLLPMQYESGHIFWQPGTIFITYAAEKYLGALSSYLLFSCIFIATSFTLSLIVTRSLLFAGSLSFMFAFGTQLNYSYTYGSLIPLYLVQTYCAINLSIVALLLSDRIRGLYWSASFVLSLCLVVLASEWGLNYAAALVAAAVSGLIWAQRHQQRHILSVCRFVIVSTISLVGLYLLVRLQYPGQFTTRGEEDELMFSYPKAILMAEDFITNYFTFLYMSLDNYLPSFVSGSNSLVYIGPEKIIAEQNGYHQQYQNLVLMSHVFMWRFYAGIAVTLFAGCLFWVASVAWRDRTPRAAIVVALMLMVATGFATHLFIKMRPYNAVPALSYKVVISVAALTVLLSYVIVISREWVRSAAVHRSLITGVLACVFLAALTRPGMQAQLLKHVGLVGLRDPMGQLARLVRH
jgi:hypothetical protein